jgi:hypothetical protein
MFLPHAFNTIDSSTFIRSDAFCVYHGNDNFLDAKVLNRARTQLGKLDVAFIPYAFIHWYPHLLHSLTEQERGEEAMRLKQQSLQQARDMISVFRPKLSIPAGSSLFYADSAESPLNYSVADPWDLGHGSVPMFAGDYHIKGDEVASHAFTSQPPFAGPIDYQNALYRFLERKKQPPLQNKTRIAEHFLGYIKQKIRSARSINEDHLVIVNNVAIDLNSLQVYTTVDPKPPYTKFAFAAKEFMKWIHGQITLEQAIGTRRFICHREPNVYNLKVFEFINTYL